jgi:putative hydrolase of the HAD superfamily
MTTPLAGIAQLPQPEPTRLDQALFDSVQAVTFDVGGTLIECWPSVGHIYADEAARHGFTGIDPDILNQRFAAAWRAFKDFRHTKTQWCALVDQIFLGLTERPPSKTFFPRLFERFAQADAWRVYEDVLPTLGRLTAQGLKLGIISNWDERLRPLLAKLKLDSYFHPIIVSCEVGVPKPAPAIFAAARSSFGLPPETILHIGDSFERDVLGARAAGLQTLLLHRRAEPGALGEIPSLAELTPN